MAGPGAVLKATENLALFSGYFEGIMEVENKQGELEAANMICPRMLEVNLTDGTQRGWGRCIIATRDGDRIYAGIRAQRRGQGLDSHPAGQGHLRDPAATA